MNILVVSPHPDDETLGCGGTLLKHKNNGDRLFWLIMTKMTTRVGYSEQRIRTRAKEIKMVAEVYQFGKVFLLDFTTTTLDTVPQREIVGAISKVIAEIKPRIVYLPHRSDIHSDHHITFDAAMATLKTFRAPFVSRVLVYETLSETEFSTPFQSDAFVPNSFSDISDYLDKKIEVMRIYKSEIGVHPFPRSEEGIRALAIVRGATASCKYAESFIVIKEII